MNLIIMKDLINDFELNIDEIKELLLRNGVDGFKKTPTSQHSDFEHYTKTTLEKQLEDIEKETEIDIPEQPFFSLFYNLDDNDFKAAYLYSPYFSNYLMMRDPQLQNMINISEGLTRLAPIALVNVYDGKRWALPRVQIYQHGTLIKESEAVGNESYDPDFGEKDEQKYLERAIKNAGIFKKKIDGL